MTGTQVQSTGTRNELLRELVVATGIVAMLLAAVGGLYWAQTGANEAAAGTPKTVTRTLEAKTPAPLPLETAIHADIYFDFKSARLSADASKLLQDKATAMIRTESWVALVQGYTDAQGPAEYNRRLAQRRADAVKKYLVELGVAEGSIKVATVGPEAALCDEPAKQCQQLNRRVHLEIRKLGSAKTALAPAGTDVQQP
jgi:peptidoglycan-associated lipoprotein